MSDHDRGAYTPQPDAPLQFDARGPRGGRRPLPMTLIGSAGVLVVLLGALALHYQHGVRGAGDPARPVGEPIASIKTAAPAGTAPHDPAVGADVYGAKTPEAAKIPTFAAAPETVQPRPAPRGLTVQVEGAAPKPAALAAAPVTSVKTTTTTTIAAVPTKLTAGTAAVKKVAETPVAAPAKTVVAGKTLAAKPVATAAAKTAATPVVTPAAKSAIAKTAGGSAVVQIGAFSSTALADKGWSDVSSAMSGDMAGKSKRIEALEKNGATLYRTSVTGFSTRAAADSFCSGLKAKGKICFVKQ